MSHTLMGLQALVPVETGPAYDAAMRPLQLDGSQGRDSGQGAAGLGRGLHRVSAWT